MSKHVRIEDLALHVGEKVELEGWLYNKRSSGKLHFLEVRDGSGICQCVVFKGDVSPELFAAADRLSQEDGKWQKFHRDGWRQWFYKDHARPSKQYS